MIKRKRIKNIKEKSNIEYTGIERNAKSKIFNESKPINDLQISLANQYQNKKESIDSIIQNIINKVKVVQPENLMNYLVSMKNISELNKTSEIQYSFEECFSLRTVEYLQSVLLAYGSVDSSHILDDQSLLYEELQSLTINLFQQVQEFYCFWSAKMNVDKEIIDDEITKYIVESQLMSFVRGNRYQEFQIPYLKQLLVPHDNIFSIVYDLSADELIQGLSKLEYSLSSGKADAINDVQDSMVEFGVMQDTIKDKSEFDAWMESIKEEKKSQIGKLIGLDLYEVKKVTNWNDRIIDCLSYEIGKEQSLFEHDEFNGWPIWNLPVQRRPFIKINGISYCFDYNNLFDNIYRIIQKSVCSISPEYGNTWSHIQQSASESLVESLFKKLLPGCNTYIENYYPKKSSLKECNENDILVLYKDVLIIIEVKAGSFSYTPALTDYDSHVSSFKKLIEKADNQCKRTLDYINAYEEVSFYDHEKIKKVSINNSLISQVYTFCVNVDDFNAFTAKAEKISFINIQEGTIAISINDLWVYAEYFDSPLIFLHFLKQRKLATAISNLYLNDELDHLGMYIQHNMYSKVINEVEQGTYMNAYGYREDLDKYFVGLHSDQLDFEKPVFYLPRIFQTMLNIILSSIENKNLIKFTDFLLDFSSDAKEEFEKQVKYILNREKELRKTFPAITFGELRYCLYIEQPNIELEPLDNRMDYIYSAMLSSEAKDYYMICLSFDDKHSLMDLNYRFLQIEDIPEDRIDELRSMGEINKKSRMMSYMYQQNKKKIYPNEPCPCGSEKKYKKCCGRNI